MVRAERVLEAGVCSTGINEVCPSELTDIPESLKDFRVYEVERELVDPNVVPDWIAQDLEPHGPSLCGRYPFGPAFFVADSTLPNFSKFSRNILARFFACAS
jgi:hypothetical protein